MLYNSTTCFRCPTCLIDHLQRKVDHQQKEVWNVMTPTDWQYFESPIPFEGFDGPNQLFNYQYKYEGIYTIIMSNL